MVLGFKAPGLDEVTRQWLVPSQFFPESESIVSQLEAAFARHLFHAADVMKGKDRLDAARDVLGQQANGSSRSDGGQMTVADSKGSNLP
jgi:hypothetical protein